MRKAIILMMVLVMVAMVGSAFASNNVLEFTGSPMGKVTFDGKAHNTALGAGKCMECHKGNEPFPMKKPGDEGSVKITMKDHNGGTRCFTCHNGEKAFESKGNCQKCHVK